MDQNLVDDVPASPAPSNLEFGDDGEEMMLGDEIPEADGADDTGERPLPVPAALADSVDHSGAVSRASDMPRCPPCFIGASMS